MRGTKRCKLIGKSSAAGNRGVLREDGRTTALYGVSAGPGARYIGEASGRLDTVHFHGEDTPPASLRFSPAVPAKTVPAGENYSVGHANFVLAYTKDNLAHVIYPGGVTQEDWVHDLPQLVQATWSSR